MEWVSLNTCGFSQSPKQSLTKAINRSNLKLILSHSLMRFSSCTLCLGSSFMFWFTQVRQKKLAQGSKSQARGSL